mgnify:CR=1 FL=1
MILFDLPIYQFIMSIFPVNNTILTIMKLITTLGSTLVIVSGILSVAVISWKNKKIFLSRQKSPVNCQNFAPKPPPKTENRRKVS